MNKEEINALKDKILSANTGGLDALLPSGDSRSQLPRYTEVETAFRDLHSYVGFVIDTYDIRDDVEFTAFHTRCAYTKMWLDSHKNKTTLSLHDLGGQERFRFAQMLYINATKIAVMTLPIEETLKYEIAQEGVDPQQKLIDFVHTLVIGSKGKSDFDYFFLLRTKFDNLLATDELYEDESEDFPDFSDRIRNRLTVLEQLEEKDRAGSEDSLVKRILDVYNKDWVKTHKSEIEDILRTSFPRDAETKYSDWLSFLSDAEEVKMPKFVGTEYSTMFYSIPPFSVFGAPRLIAQVYDNINAAVKVAFIGDGAVGKTTFIKKVSSDQEISRLDKNTWEVNAKKVELIKIISGLYELFGVGASMTIGVGIEKLEFDNHDLLDLRNITQTAASMMPESFGFTAPKIYESPVKQKDFERVFNTKKFNIRPELYMQAMNDIKEERRIGRDLSKTFKEVSQAAKLSLKEHLKQDSDSKPELTALMNEEISECKLGSEITTPQFLNDDVLELSQKVYKELVKYVEKLRVMPHLMWLENKDSE